MTLAVRAVAIVVLAALFAGGPLLPLAHAQQPTPPAVPPPAPQPGIFQETPKTPDQTQEALKPGEPSALDPVVYDVAAGVATAFLIPGRTVTCVLGSAFGLTFLALTFGTGYRWAMGAVEEGCGGKWVVRGTDLRADGPLSPGSETR
jgi:hypothetical protein